MMKRLHGFRLGARRRSGSDIVSEMAEEPASLTLNFKRILRDPEAPPKPGQRFIWTRVGPDYQLDVGYFDLPELRAVVEEARSAPKKESTTPVAIHVTDRFNLTIANVVELAAVVEQMMMDVRQQMKAAGVSDLGASVAFKEEAK